MPTSQTHSEPVTELRRQYVKLCDLGDFDDPELRNRIGSIVPAKSADDQRQRKFWEYGMLALFLEEVGKLDEHASILAVGAGHEEVLYWLANRVGRVVATDIYGEGAFSGEEANRTMLTHPEAFAPYEYRHDRLQVLRMDARALEFADASFDAVFSLSSIEHFGALGDVAAAAREVGRVLRPGGYAFIVTECFVGRHVLDSALVHTAIRLATFGRRCGGSTPHRRGVEVFTPREIERWIVEPSGLRLLQPFDLSLADGSWANIATLRSPEEILTTTGRWTPHILVRARGAPWTSLALALVKDA